jgi:hypothetical protein
MSLDSETVSKNLTTINIKDGGGSISMRAIGEISKQALRSKRIIGKPAPKKHYVVPKKMNFNPEQTY